MELKKIKNIRAKFSKLPEKKIIKKSVLKPVQWKWQLSYPLHCQRRAFHHPGCDSSPAARSYTSKSPAASMGWQSTRWRIVRGSQQPYPARLEPAQGQDLEGHFLLPGIFHCRLWPATCATLIDLTAWNTDLVDGRYLYQHFTSLAMEIHVSTFMWAILNQRLDSFFQISPKGIIQLCRHYQLKHS